ncbi:hypothetical protein IW01_05390 [Pectobacterium brasiliense]|uniref:hypothetical protein n=1 Tax=Pectobacterium brasiliense TaxID=180957 RepID=UPI0004E74263|nr:hypothetical protein [Pectobacterium brasiliense]KFF72052.1 hypothetical protein IW01_05390 [Pectobacterium brasiliense]
MFLPQPANISNAILILATMMDCRNVFLFNETVLFNENSCAAIVIVFFPVFIENIEPPLKKNRDLESQLPLMGDIILLNKPHLHEGRFLVEKSLILLH